MYNKPIIDKIDDINAQYNCIKHTIERVDILPRSIFSSCIFDNLLNELRLFKKFLKGTMSYHNDMFVSLCIIIPKDIANIIMSYTIDYDLLLNKSI